MKNESDFRDPLKTHTLEGGRNTAVTMVVIALFVAVVFVTSKIVIEIARPYLPVHGARDWISAKPTPLTVPR